MSEDLYTELVSSLDLTGISLVECEAKRVGAAEANVDLQAEFALDTSHRVLEREIDYRFQFTCKIAQNDEPVAEISATYVTAFESSEPHQATSELVGKFAQDVAVMAAYPYFREFVQSMAARLDLPGFTMGLVKRGDIILALTADDTAKGSDDGSGS